MPLQIDRVSKRFGNNWVLKDITLEVADGEVFGVLGASGSGKSVLLRIIRGLEKPNGGSVSGTESGVTLVPEPKRSLWSSLVGSGSSAAADGEARRLEFEGAFDCPGNVLLLDNPLAGADPALRGRCLADLRKKASERKMAVVFATNDPEQIFAACDRFAVLSGMEIVQVGEPREVYESPNSVASAVAAGRINLIEARRLSKSDSEMPEFQTIAGAHRLFTGKVEKRMLGPINQNITLAIRPEHISISFGASFPEDNLLRATVSGVSYRGATTLVTLDAGGIELEAMVLRLVGLKIGDECMVGLPPDRIHVLRD